MSIIPLCQIYLTNQVHRRLIFLLYRNDQLTLCLIIASEVIINPPAIVVILQLFSLNTQGTLKIIPSDARKIHLAVCLINIQIQIIVRRMECHCAVKIFFCVICIALVQFTGSAQIIGILISIRGILQQSRTRIHRFFIFRKAVLRRSQIQPQIQPVLRHFIIRCRKCRSKGGLRVLVLRQSHAGQSESPVCQHFLLATLQSLHKHLLCLRIIPALQRLHALRSLISGRAAHRTAAKQY